MITDSDVRWLKKHRATIKFYDAYGIGRARVSIPGGYMFDRENVEDALLGLRKIAGMGEDELDLVNLLTLFVQREDFCRNKMSDGGEFEIAKEALRKLGHPFVEESGSG